LIIRVYLQKRMMRPHNKDAAVGGSNPLSWTWRYYVQGRRYRPRRGRRY
jgi:hypothetical protein